VGSGEAAVEAVTVAGASEGKGEGAVFFDDGEGAVAGVGVAAGGSETSWARG